MASQAKEFKCFNTLEKELDNNFVDMDLMLNNLELTEDELVDNLRTKINSLCSIFAQIVHKCQTVLENNAKLEAQNLNLKKDLEDTLSENLVQREELNYLIQQVHCMQLKMLNIDSNDTDSVVILEKMNKEMLDRMEMLRPVAKLETNVKLLSRENIDMKQYITALQSELYGARLAAKYLDKELAGRIQQIQLLGRKMEGSEYEHLWTTLESEISLQRQKTVVKACKGCSDLTKSTKIEPQKDKHNILRKVRLLKQSTENLGMSVTGGQEHGVPLIISEIYPNQPVARSGQLFVGDAIFGVNGTNLKYLRHVDAVKVLCEPMEEIYLDVMYISHDDEDDKLDSKNVFVTDEGYMYRLYHHPSMSNNTQHQPMNNSTEAQYNNNQSTSKSDLRKSSDKN